MNISSIGLEDLKSFVFIFQHENAEKLREGFSGEADSGSRFTIKLCILLYNCLLFIDK